MLLQLRDAPRAGDPECGSARQERALRAVSVHPRADEAETVPPVDERRIAEERLVRDAEQCGVEVAGGVRSEDVPAEAGEERVHVVAVTRRSLLHREREVALALVLERERRLLELGPRRRN